MLVKYLRSAIICLIALGLAGVGSAETRIPKKKQTALGLYITAERAYALWQQGPSSVHILDVRTPEEYYFVGHTSMARHIPVRFLDQKASLAKGMPVLVWNTDFVRETESHYKLTDRILVMCRSGGRSAAAVDLLAKAGFTQVFNIIDGFEGDVLRDPKSRDHGKRVVNGWRNSGAPWTYAIDPNLVYRH